MKKVYNFTWALLTPQSHSGLPVPLKRGCADRTWIKRWAFMARDGREESLYGACSLKLQAWVS